MQIEIFTVPVKDPQEAQAELNAFLRSHRVLTVDRQLVGGEGDSPCWVFCVEYLEGGVGKPPGPARTGQPKVDYKEVLSEAEFVVYVRLRDLRKRLSEEAATPAYAVFTNEQLAKMVTEKVTSGAAMERIDGVGPARVGKYGDAFLAVLREAYGGGETALP